MSAGSRVGLMFSGQGSQQAGMGEPWRATAAWRVVDVIASNAEVDVAELLLHMDDDALRRTDRAQIATFAQEMVVLAHYRSTTGDASVVATAGHSLGEYSALVAAGVLDLVTASRLVAVRGAAMLRAAEAAPGTMVAVVGVAGTDVVAALEPLQRDGAQVWAANFNGSDQTVVAGDGDGIERVTAALAGRGRVLPLPVGGAFHTPLMATAEAALRRALETAAFDTGSAPVVANVDGRPHEGGTAWRERLAQQLTSPVRWVDSVLALTGELGCTELVEIGPGTTLSNMVKRIARGTPTSTVAIPSPRE